jgi:hypothetical protein
VIYILKSRDPGQVAMLIGTAEWIGRLKDEYFAKGYRAVRPGTGRGLAATADYHPGLPLWLFHLEPAWELDGDEARAEELRHRFRAGDRPEQPWTFPCPELAELIRAEARPWQGFDAELMQVKGLDRATREARRAADRPAPAAVDVRARLRSRKGA